MRAMLVAEKPDVLRKNTIRICDVFAKTLGFCRIGRNMDRRAMQDHAVEIRNRQPYRINRNIDRQHMCRLRA